MTPGHQGPDWYSVLRVERAASEAEISEALELLSRRASSMAATSPERAQQLRDTIRAIRGDLLTDIAARRRYDESLAPAPRTDPPVAAPPPLQALTCAACSQPSSPGDRFCTKCGAPMQGAPPGVPAPPGPTCRVCGAPAEAGDRFCTTCGKPLG